VGVSAGPVFIFTVPLIKVGKTLWKATGSDSFCTSGMARVLQWKKMSMVMKRAEWKIGFSLNFMTIQRNLPIFLNLIQLYKKNKITFN
jgi:hypothetical protein